MAISPNKYLITGLDIGVTLSPTFYLFNTTNQKVDLPVWFQRYFINCHLEQKKLFENQTGLSKKNVDGIELEVSVPERAILEILALVPNKFTLSHANELIEGLDRLRAEVIQNLLEHCHSVKVKRLFLFLAEKNNLSCFADLKLDKLDLGAGKRVIGAGGSYNAKWMISLPKSDNLNDEIGDDNE